MNFIKHQIYKLACIKNFNDLKNFFKNGINIKNFDTKDKFYDGIKCTSLFL